MDGINPTLAFAALFFGLSGHPHNAATETAQLQSADQLVWSGVECPDLAIAARDPDPWRDAFAHETAMASTYLGESEDAQAAEELESGLAMPPEESELLIEDVAAPDGCGVLTPQP